MVWKRYFLHNLVGLSIYVTFHGCIVPLEEVLEILHLFPNGQWGRKNMWCLSREACFRYRTFIVLGATELGKNKWNGNTEKSRAKLGDGFKDFFYKPLTGRNDLISYNPRHPRHPPVIPREDLCLEPLKAEPQEMFGGSSSNTDPHQAFG